MVTAIVVAPQPVAERGRVRPVGDHTEPLLELPVFLTWHGFDGDSCSERPASGLSGWCGRGAHATPRGIAAVSGGHAPVYGRPNRRRGSYVGYAFVSDLAFAVDGEGIPLPALVHRLARCISSSRTTRTRLRRHSVHRRSGRQRQGSPLGG